MQVPFVDLARANQAFAPEIEAALHAVARSGQYILGPHLAELEAAVAQFLGLNHAVGVNSGTDALHLAVVAAGIGPGDEVITTPFTFAATLEAILYAGATPVLVDIDPVTFNLDPQQVADAVTPRTRAILPVHLFGLPAAMDPIMDTADRHGLAVIEDCAQSFGARRNGIATGRFGAMGAYSFYPTKTLGCLGDGGMVCTDDPALDARLRRLRHHGNDGTGRHVELGYNSRLDDVQAAVLLAKLARIDAMNQRRREIAARYDAVLAPAGITVPAPDEAAVHVYGCYTVCLDDRDRVRRQLQAKGVATALYYSQPLHTHGAFMESCRFGALPNVDSIARRCLSLPIFPEMTDEEVEYVAHATARVSG